MRVVAPAKINLHLRVGRVREDGFHPLLTWMCIVDLFDTLTLIRRPWEQSRGVASGGPLSHGDWFALSTDHPDLPLDRRNLVVDAAMALADTLSRDGEGPTGWRERVSAFLNKRIPAGAGLGGGSSDAAATLLALAAMWKLDWSASKLAEFSTRLGSDVPFFFHGPSSICTGRGEIVRPTPPPARAKFAVLVLSDIAMPTPKVYATLDALKLGSDAALSSPPDFAEWAKLSADELMQRLVNDLEAPAFHLQPKLAATRTALEKLWNGKIVRMSGSGSSLFTLCDEQSQAQELAGKANGQAIEGAKVIAKVVRLAPQRTCHWRARARNRRSGAAEISRPSD